MTIQVANLVYSVLGFNSDGKVINGINRYLTLYITLCFRGENVKNISEFSSVATVRSPEIKQRNATRNGLRLEYAY